MSAPGAIDEERGEDCLRCGLCDAHCPALGARARFSGPRAIGPDASRLRGSVPPEPEPALAGCLGCGTCELVCPRGLGPWRLGRRAKEALVAESGLSPAEAVLSRGPSLGPLGSFFAPLSNALMRTPLARLGESLLGLDLGVGFPGWARPRLRRLVGRSRAVLPPGQQSPILFAGCFCEYNQPAPALAALRMLEAAGLKAVLAPSVCCGLPAMIKGDRARAARIAGHALKRLSPVLEAAGGPLLFLSPSCLWMVKELWPSLNGEAAEAAADRAAEATGFILGALRARLAETGLKPAKRHLAYQAPCHLRLSQSRLPAFGLARLIPGVELHDLGQGCCGQGGTYGMERANANVAATIGRRFEAALNERPYDGLVSECEACRMRLASLSGLKTWHPLEILAEAIE